MMQTQICRLIILYSEL